MITLNIETIEEQQRFIDAYLHGLLTTSETAQLIGSRTEYIFEQGKTDEDERTQRIIEKTAFRIMQTGEAGLISYILNEIEDQTEAAQLTYWELQNSISITHIGPGHNNGIEYKQANSIEQLLEITKAITKLTGATVELIGLTPKHDIAFSIKGETGRLLGSISARL